jgi:hypothetical protein
MQVVMAVGRTDVVIAKALESLAGVNAGYGRLSSYSTQASAQAAAQPAQIAT